MHVSAESRKQRHRLNNQAAPLPDGKLGTTSEGFPQYNKLGSVRNECELHVRMSTSAHVLTMRSQGRQQEEQQKELTEKHPKSSSGHVSKRNED